MHDWSAWRADVRHCENERYLFFYAFSQLYFSSRMVNLELEVGVDLDVSNASEIRFSVCFY